MGLLLLWSQLWFSFHSVSSSEESAPLPLMMDATSEKSSSCCNLRALMSTLWCCKPRRQPCETPYQAPVGGDIHGLYGPSAFDSVAPPAVLPNDNNASPTRGRAKRQSTADERRQGTSTMERRTYSEEDLGGVDDRRFGIELEQRR